MVSSLAMGAAIVAIPIRARGEAPRVDLASMSYGQSGCYGTCIGYDVTLRSDGLVVFEAQPSDKPEDIVTGEDIRDPVAAGRHEYHVSPQRAEALLAEFRAGGLFALKDSYNSGIADAQSYTIGFSDGGRSKTISDNGGERVGMPTRLIDLMRETVTTSEANRMANGRVGMVGLLESGGYDFRSPDAGKMLIRAIARQADSTTIRSLINKGAPLGVKWDGRTFGSWAVHAAVTFDDLATLKLLSERGEIQRLSADERNEIAASVNPCSVDKARKLKLMGFDPVAAEKAGGTSVLKRAGSCSTQDGSDKISDLFRYYLAQGANPNAAIPSGETAIFELWDADAVDILVKHGADVNHLNKEGDSAVFSTWSEDAIVRLLDAGTKPVGDYFGTKFWDYAVSKKWMKITTWLEAHPKMKAVAQGK